MAPYVQGTQISYMGQYPPLSVYIRPLLLIEYLWHRPLIVAALSGRRSTGTEDSNAYPISYTMFPAWADHSVHAGAGLGSPQ